MNRRTLRHTALGLVALAALATSSLALADRGGHGHGHGHRGSRVGIGLYLGPGFGYPYYYPGPSYYWPPVVTVPAAPPQYIERGDDLPGTEGNAFVQPAPAWWYYCANPEGYHPYVQSCPGGWQRVPAQPPAPAGSR